MKNSIMNWLREFWGALLFFSLFGIGILLFAYSQGCTGGRIRTEYYEKQQVYEIQIVKNGDIIPITSVKLWDVIHDPTTLKRAKEQTKAILDSLNK